MIVVHGSWLPATGDAGPCFAIWGEVAEDTAPAARPRARARKKEGQGAPRPHPFGASAPALFNAVAAGELAGDAAQSDIIVRLPTLGDAPLPSRPFLRENEPEGTPTLAPWRVIGLLFEPGDALALLARLPAPDDTTPGVDIGEDLRFWAAAARFTLHLLAGQRFTPALVEQGDHFLACWRPTLDAPGDRTTFDQLAQATPPASRALARAPTDPTPGPRTLLTDFLNATVDARARHAADFGLRPPKGRRSAAHMWLAGLADDEPEIRPPPAFVEQYRAWAQAAEGAGAGNFRICFRLDPPTTPADDDFFLPAAGARDWALRYFLQAADDLSLLVPAETAWRQRGRALTFLNRVFDQPQERLLAGLGQAARMFAPIERSLAEARPQAALLTAGEAYEFLREAGLLLQASGFGVLLPSLGPGLKARAKLKPKRKAAKGGVARLSFESIIQFDWELALGGQQITRAELERLAALKVPLVQVRGQWVELRPEQLEQALTFWDKRADDGELSLAEALRLALAPNEVAGVPVSDVEAEDWFSDMLHELSEGARLAPLPQPGELKGELRHYQVTGFSWLAFLRGYGLGACLADDMGLGKCTSADTLIAINGNLRTAESIWDIYAGEVQFDGEGFWTTPVEKLLVNSIDENTGHIVETCIRRLYRQHVEERLRKITLEDGSSITITQRHRLLTSKGWTRELHVNDYVGVPATTRQQLQQLLDQEVFYCRIKSIDEIEYKGWVYDFEVTEHHNFVANNIICHNTIQTISLLLHEKEQNPKIKPALLICPTSVVSNWQREVARFAPALRVLIHQGAERRKEDFAAEVAGHDLVISSYALLPRDEQQLVEVEWGAVILDEAQNIKNADTRQAQVARRLQAEHRIALTGTPVENRLSELWSIFQFLNPGYLGGQSDFQAQFARPIERVQDADAAQRLKALVGPFILRRLKTDPTVISDLPAKNEIKVFCPLTKEQATLYAAIVRDSLQQIEASEGIQRRGLVLATLMKLKQICNHPAQFLKDNSALPDRSGKLARLTEMLEEVRAVKERALIFTQFAEMGQMLKAHLQGVFGDEVLFLHGGTPTKQREVQIRRFQDDPHGPLTFILSIKAGGTGLNLTRANNVFHFDRWWNPAVENQATDRAFRIGQTRNVQVYKFVCAGTTEERIDEMIERKKALAEQIVGSSENWITELSTDQLRDLFALRQDAIV